jgi:hypothetical protein
MLFPNLPDKRPFNIIAMIFNLMLIKCDAY